MDIYNIGAVMTYQPDVEPTDYEVEDGAEAGALEAIAANGAVAGEIAGLDLSDLSAVDVSVEKLEGRRRGLQAQIEIAHSKQSIWEVLTDYQRLAEFIPNLAESNVIGEEDGCPILYQVGVQKFAVLKFSAAVTLKMTPRPMEEILFEMMEGDFVEFAGAWALSAGATQSETVLQYSCTILPPRKMPIQIVQRRLRKDLAVNLLAIRHEVGRRAILAG